MRDYNSIQFRSPKPPVKRATDHPLGSPVPADDKEVTSRESTNTESTFTAATSDFEPGGGGRSSPNKNLPSSQTALAASEALAMRRDGAETTILKLRNALEESNSKDATAKTALAKSDAIVLELRSSVRQLKRQLEKVQEEKQEAEKEHQLAMEKVKELQERNDKSAWEKKNEKKLAAENDQARDSKVGELQVQLDRAHAQILTADMVRKELEDTLEAEQYTWELRVQDQERTIQQLQQECSTLAEDLEQCRRQWKEAEDGWTQEVQELQANFEKAQQEAQHWKAMQKDNSEVAQLKEKLLSLERGRAELQSCLDEALKELEAVDAELQGDNANGVLREENERLKKKLQDKDKSFVEPLQHLYRLLLERDGIEESVHSSPRDAKDVLSAIQSHLERVPANDKSMGNKRKQVAELEAQLSVYRGDLKAREESSAELRASLKEAVALLKPLQDAVAKADREKARLQDKVEKLQNEHSHTESKKIDELKQFKERLEAKETENDLLNQRVQSLEIELSKAKVAAASSLTSPSKQGDVSSSDSVSKAREELKARRSAENTLKQLLRDAQHRFSTLHQQNVEVEAMNSELQGRLKDAEKHLSVEPSVESRQVVAKQDDAEGQGTSLSAEREAELSVVKNKLNEKEKELARLHKELVELRSASRSTSDEQQSKLHEAQARSHEMEVKLATITSELQNKKQSERALNRSLKEALGLLRPLQMHLEDAEREKKQLWKEVRLLRRKSCDENSMALKLAANANESGDPVRELRDTIRQLEKENSQLHDALEDMSQTLNASQVSGGTAMSQKNEARLREEIVELKSRYHVTQGRLEDAFVENHTLVEALKKREQEEHQLADELHFLKDRLKRAESELENAKFVATSALVKVEEVTMPEVGEPRTIGSDGFDREALYKEKAKELELEMKMAMDQPNRVPSRMEGRAY